MSDRDLPEGVINADPAGGWESEDVVDDETSTRNRDSWGSPELTDSGSSANEPVSVDTDAVESDDATQGADPDLSADSA